jgi:hypothetical protein
MSLPAFVRKKGRNSTIVGTINADVLFLPGGDVNRWTSRLATLTEKKVTGFAPRRRKDNRPRWVHEGPRLRTTIRSSGVEFRSTPSGMRVYARVGSSSRYAVYVDQGTGIHAGGAPYRGKILPPWQVGEPSLYESSWVPPGSSRPLGPVMIKGQEGKQFFAKGLNRAFRQMMKQGDGQPVNPVKMGAAIRSWPRVLENFSGATPNDAAFKVSLEQWREWRDEAFQNNNLLGRRQEEGKPTPDSPAKSRNRKRGTAAAEERAKNRADKATAERDAGGKSRVKEVPETAKSRAKQPSYSEAAKRFLEAMIKEYGADAIEGGVFFKDGYWIAVLITGKDEKGRPIYAEAKRKSRFNYPNTL